MSFTEGVASIGRAEHCLHIPPSILHVFGHILMAYTSNILFPIKVFLSEFRSRAIQGYIVKGDIHNHVRNINFIEKGYEHLGHLFQATNEASNMPMDHPLYICNFQITCDNNMPRG